MFSLFSKTRFLITLACAIAAQALCAPNYVLDGEVGFATADSAPELISAVISSADRNENKAAVQIDYPFNDSVFPPEIVAPTFLWHDPQEKANAWVIKVSLEEGSPIYALTTGKQPEQNIDPRAVSPMNEHYKRPDYDLSARAWTPDRDSWETIKMHSVDHPATVSVYGFDSNNLSVALSSGAMQLRTSTDPVGAPIFYRDVPLMPPESAKVIQPLAEDALEIIAWRLRDISKDSAPAVLQDMPTCANCHSFSGDGAVLGMDMDGPSGDKGAYGLVDVEQNIVIEKDDIITWNSYKDTPKGHMNFGLFSQVSPDGRYVVSTLNESVFVVNYKDFGFGQAFYPTRGILVVYDRETGEMNPLPGGSSTNYVQTNATWSPDGKYLVFSRAPAKDRYEHSTMPLFAGDKRETEIQYDLYRIPFNDGKGGTAVPIKGASKNGMSNSFPKISPDGKWIVFVKSEKGQLMRPDSRLYIIPAEGGEAREMNCNLDTMNSWHSWSPNGKWMVFSSKGLRPFTQMFLTHIDNQGMDTPAILIPNSTADNRAVNIPEFLNGSGNAIAEIKAPTQYPYRLYRDAEILADSGKLQQALDNLDESISLNPYYDVAHYTKGRILLALKRYEEAKASFERAVELKPNTERNSYQLGAAIETVEGMDKGIAFYRNTLKENPDFTLIRGRLVEIYLARNEQAACMEECRMILTYAPQDVTPRLLLARFLIDQQKFDEGKKEFETVLIHDPENVQALTSLSWILATDPKGSPRQKNNAVSHAFRAASLSQFKNAEVVDALAIAQASAGKFKLANNLLKQAEQLGRKSGNLELLQLIKEQRLSFDQEKPWANRERQPGMIFSSY